MSLFSATVHRCPLSFHEDSTHEDCAYVSKDQWDNLLSSSTYDLRTREIERLAISVDMYPIISSYHAKNNALGRSIYWVPSPISAPFAPANGISLPLSLEPRITSKPNDRGSSECFVRLIQPVQLTDVFLSTSSPRVFQNARDHTEQIEGWFCKNNRIIRTSDTVCYEDLREIFGESVGSEIESSATLQIVLTEPVTQGFAVPYKTRILITLNEHPTKLDSVVNGSTDGLDELTEKLDGECFDIDESFLANATLYNTDALHDSSYGSTVRESHPIKSHCENQTQLVQDVPSSSVNTHTLYPPRQLLVQPLNHNIESGADGTFTVFVRTDELSKIGIFDGDWAIASFHKGHQRLVHIRASDLTAPTGGSLYASPTLIRNAFEGSTNGTVVIRPTRYRTNTLPIPSATSVSIARVASPLSLDKSYDHVLLHSLKAYFEKSIRLAKKGDIVSVPVCTRFISTWSNLDDDVAALFSCEEQDRHPIDDIAFFLITDITYANTSHVDTAHGEQFRSETDLMLSGEVGCWIDSTLCKMVQVGIEHCYVPDMSKYYGLRHATHSEPITSLQSQSRLHDFVVASTRPDAPDYDMDPTLLVKGPHGSMIDAIVHRIGRYLGFHIIDVNVYDLIQENETRTGNKLIERFVSATSCSPCILLLSNIDALAQNPQAQGSNAPHTTTVSSMIECISHLKEEWKTTRLPVLVIATTMNADSMSVDMLSCFGQDITFDAPQESQRLDILRDLFSDVLLSPEISLSKLAMQTAAMMEQDLNDLASRAQLCAIERSVKYTDSKVTENDLIQAGITLTLDDLNKALELSRASYSASIGAPSIPAVSWDDIGGLASIKKDILDTVQLPLEHPELFAEGILLYGPPGTGKTLLAKAVATTCSLNFFSIKGPELLNMYIGESEANVRRVFQRARDAKPCVIFFDELDSVAPKRGNQGDSGGVMDRIVSQLLAELDGMSTSTEVFVIGATNRPDLLDPALLRPGRFDRMLYLGVSDTHNAQLNILEALTRKFRLDPDLDLRIIADQCPFNFTGADFYALCSDAMLRAMARKVDEVDGKIVQLNEELGSSRPHITPQYYFSEFAKPHETEVIVSRQDFEQALHDLVPSVSQSELEQYAAMQQRFIQSK